MSEILAESESTSEEDEANISEIDYKFVKNVTDELISQWENDPSIMYRVAKIPEGFQIVENVNDGISLIAITNFNVGDVLFTYESEIFDTNVIKTLILGFDLTRQNGHTERVYMEMEFIVHTVNRGNTLREFFGFDSFSDHSCDPNNDFQYVEGPGTLKTISIARKPIAIGDKITCDYSGFETHFDGTVFQCLCGATNCMGDIKG
jgi:hypothetical protein